MPLLRVDIQLLPCDQLGIRIMEKIRKKKIVYHTTQDLPLFSILPSTGANRV